jgi:subtilisin family serine protease
MKRPRNIVESRFIEAELWTELTEGQLSQTDVEPVPVVINFQTESDANNFYKALSGSPEQDLSEGRCSAVRESLKVKDFYNALQSLGVGESFGDAIAEASLQENEKLTYQEKTASHKEKVSEMPVAEIQLVLFGELSSVSMTLPSAEVRGLEVALQSNSETELKLGSPRIEKAVKFVECNEESTLHIGINPKIWDLRFDGSGIKVGVIDSGLDINHPDFDASRVIYIDIDYPDNPRADDSGHGTHVSGSILGNGSASNGKYRGMAPGATLVNIKALHNGTGNTPTIARSVIKLVKLGCDIINMGLASRTPNTGMDYLARIVNKAVTDYGVCCIVAAGNSGPASYTIGSPGAAEQAITVGAVDNTDKVVDFTSRGPVQASLDSRDRKNRKPDIVAPGLDIMSARANRTNGGGIGKGTKLPFSPALDSMYSYSSGTSMATAMTSGISALLLQAYKKNQRISDDDWLNIRRKCDGHGKNLAQKVKQALIETAHHLDGEDTLSQGQGLIQPHLALQHLVRSMESTN